MKRLIRPSCLADAVHFVGIKERLPLDTESDHTQQGGFLLGTDLDTYQFYVDHGSCLSAEVGGEVVGFGIMLPNHLVKRYVIPSKI